MRKSMYHASPPQGMHIIVFTHSETKITNYISHYGNLLFTVCRILIFLIVPYTIEIFYE